MKYFYFIILLTSKLNGGLSFLPHDDEFLVKGHNAQEKRDWKKQFFHHIHVTDGREGRYCRCPFNSSYYKSPLDITPILIVKLSYENSSFRVTRQESAIRPALILNEHYILMKKDYIQYLLRGNLHRLLDPGFLLFEVNSEGSSMQEGYHITRYVEYPGTRVPEFSLSFLSNDLILLQLDRRIVFYNFQQNSHGLGPACFRTHRITKSKKRNRKKADNTLQSFLGESVRIYEKRCLISNIIKGIVEYLNKKIPKLVCRNQNADAVKKTMEILSLNTTSTDNYIKLLKINNVISLNETGYLRHIGFCPSLHNTYQEVILLKTSPVTVYSFRPPRLICLSLSSYEKWLIKNMPDVQCQLYSTVV